VTADVRDRLRQLTEAHGQALAAEVDQDDAVQCQFQVAALSEWIDKGNAHRDPEAILWGRVAKLTEEAGEAVAALIGMTGQNPRKGVTHTVDDVVAELLDVAITALGAVEHLTGNQGHALPALCAKADAVHSRAVVAAAGGDGE
jgi:hypothetical protein